MENIIPRELHGRLGVVSTRLWLGSLREWVRRQVVRFRPVYIKDLGWRSTCGTRLDSGLFQMHTQEKWDRCDSFPIKPES